ncbi:MAG: xanthine dehydrogenase family protein subunit M [Ilumatobacter sp.]|uniref:FAD binding domain-containing protein n=1 Tax=Ilumatobacter sp. TaxID=1967498 RepID=UPI00262D91C7|nr:xanthine dehydrogenase family protein subunit M [Ilumatobacter sp.]MDJ0769225.1 xanthine dehydrogenase family protein subunit M [Ilumatobacter sp.]
MQTPAPFSYERATSVDHAIELLERLGPDSRIVAGGHSLLPMMKLRLAQPEAVIDINGLAGELGGISIDGSELVVGAMARHNDVLDSPLVAEHFPMLVDAEQVIADPVVRNRGTVGGSLCQADPAEDLSAALSALNAVATIRGTAGPRTVAVRELHTGPYETVVGDAEILTEIRIPIRDRCGSAYEKVERRVGDWAIAAAAVAVWMDGDTIADAGVGLAAVGAEHFVSPAAEAALRGQQPTDDVIAAAAAAAAADSSPTTDQRGPAEYKRHLAGELTARALRRAVARAQGGN